MAKRVNATRMELLRLRRRLALAKRGHKLLKDKLDGLIQKLLEAVKEQRHLSLKLEEALPAVFKKLILASAQVSEAVLSSLTKSPNVDTKVEFYLQNVMGVKVPRYKLRSKGNFASYNLANTPAELDEGLLAFNLVLEELVKLAEYNKTIQALAAQIIEIKRRVNALEYVLIPELENAVRYIRMKLTEMERSTTVSLLKIKALVASS